ncbi:LacI family DNA-binding transcriptional regulator [Nocardia caishijiensis]|uniref:LacI family DNA-binding transcriptional regulator n=1 Tax=Nocardia caishijiensis TaxID=184756 RepID=UPI001F27915A|nr:LacI family DNA-binding transcriptional regulator [Nocardia caishijiensis]
MTTRRPTLADVATLAGVSTAAVSYVLNDGPRPVSAALRAKVLAAADELHYRPDRNARALRRPRKWRQLGLLVPDLTLPLYAALAGRLEIEARDHEHLTMIGNTGYDPDRELEFASAFTDVGIDGLIVVGAVNTPEISAVCRRARVPVAWVHNRRGTVDTPTPLVGADHVAAGRLAASHLVEVHGCRDIAFVGGFTATDVEYGDRETVAQRYEGFASVIDGTVIRTDLTPAGAYRAVGEHLRAVDTAPQALVVGTNGQAAAAMRAVTDAGPRVPGDVRIVGFDGGAANQFGQITLTSVMQPIDVIAARAIGDVLDPTEPDRATRAPMPVTLHRGESCGCTTFSEDEPGRE